MHAENNSGSLAERYEKRKTDHRIARHAANYTYNHFIQSERELIYLDILHSFFEDISTIRILEIGAGHGLNLHFMKKAGIPWQHIHANELLIDRLEILRADFPLIHIHGGDAAFIPTDEQHRFEVVFQSTVFTSILDVKQRTALAGKMWELLKPGGIILWYDFVFNNPSNPDVKRVTRKEIRSLFPKAANISFKRVTLAPPIGRKVGKWYPVFNALPLIRSHVIAVLQKP